MFLPWEYARFAGGHFFYGIELICTLALHSDRRPNCTKSRIVLANRKKIFAKSAFASFAPIYRTFDSLLTLCKSKDYLKLKLDSRLMDRRVRRYSVIVANLNF